MTAPDNGVPTGGDSPPALVPLAGALPTPLVGEGAGLAAPPTTTPPSAYDEFVAFMKVFAAPREGETRLVHELRLLEVPQKYGRPRTDAGFFDLMDSDGKRGIVKALAGYLKLPPDQQPAGIYVALNPIDAIFLARANNRMGRTRDKISCEDVHILYRRWIVIDADPTRPLSGISASAAEKACARLLIDGVRDDLRSRKWPDPMLCDSGNGFHAWYPIDLPADDAGVVKQILNGLALRHNTAEATVDTKVFNASRIMKLPGTWARKGDSTAERPHRMARVLEVPPAEGSPCPA